MRNFIKQVRQKSQGNSLIFKQAKKIFHYQPSQKYHKIFHISKPKYKQHPLKQFKDEYSSVKHYKKDNYQVNQSSWIDKLVNVMGEIQKQTLKNNKQKNNNRDKKDDDIQIKEIKINVTQPQFQRTYNNKQNITNFQSKNKYQKSKDKSGSMTKSYIQSRKHSHYIDKYQKINKQNNDLKHDIIKSKSNTTINNKNNIAKNNSQKTQKQKPDIKNNKRSNLCQLINNKKIYYQKQRLKDYIEIIDIDSNIDLNDNTQQIKQVKQKLNVKQTKLNQITINKPQNKKSLANHKKDDIQFIKCVYNEQSISFDNLNTKTDIQMLSQIKSSLATEQQQPLLKPQKQMIRQKSTRSFGSIKKNKKSITQTNHKYSYLTQYQPKQSIKQPLISMRNKQNNIKEQKQLYTINKNQIKYQQKGQFNSINVFQNIDSLKSSLKYNKKYNYNNDIDNMINIQTKTYNYEQRQTKINNNSLQTSKSQGKISNYDISNNKQRSTKKYQYNTVQYGQEQDKDINKVSTTNMNSLNLNKSSVNLKEQNKKQYSYTKNSQQKFNNQPFTRTKTLQSGTNTPYKRSQSINNTPYRRLQSQSNTPFDSKLHYTEQTPQFNYKYNNYQDSSKNPLKNQQKSTLKYTYLQSTLKQQIPTNSNPITYTKISSYNSTYTNNQLQLSNNISKVNNKLRQYINNNKLNYENQVKYEGTHRKMQLNFNELKKHSEFYKV